jgi:hypothetical protein
MWWLLYVETACRRFLTWGNVVVVYLPESLGLGLQNVRSSSGDRIAGCGTCGMLVQDVSSIEILFRAIHCSCPID